MANSAVQLFQFHPWADELNYEYYLNRLTKDETPEKRLLLALIVDALLDAGIIGTRTSGGEKQEDIDYLSASARRWLLNDDDGPFTFRYCLNFVMHEARAAEDIIVFARSAIAARKRQQHRR
jgi:hypothetical protein